MANSFITSLDTLDPTSVQNVSSLFFYISNNDNSRLMSGKELQTLIGPPPSTIVCATNAQTFSPAATEVLVTYDAALKDDLGLWNASSAGAIFTNFTGFVSFRYKTDVNTAFGGPTVYLDAYIRKNGATWMGYGRYRADHPQFTWDVTHSTGVVSCQNGDRFELYVQANSPGYMNGGGKVWLECRPVEMYL